MPLVRSIGISHIFHICQEILLKLSWIARNVEILWKNLWITCEKSFCWINRTVLTGYMTARKSQISQSIRSVIPKKTSRDCGFAERNAHGIEPFWQIPGPKETVLAGRDTLHHSVIGRQTFAEKNVNKLTSEAGPSRFP